MRKLKYQLYQTHGLSMHSLTQPLGSERLAEYLTTPHTHNIYEMSNLKNQLYQLHSSTMHSITHIFGSQRLAE